MVMDLDTALGPPISAQESGHKTLGNPPQFVPTAPNWGPGSQWS